MSDNIIICATGGRTYEFSADEWVAMADELTAIKAKIAERNKSDPSWRLHNLCDALAEDAKDSPFSQESWDLQEAAYRQQAAELKASTSYAILLAATLRSVMQADHEAGDLLPESVIDEIDAALAKNPDPRQVALNAMVANAEELKLYDDQGAENAVRDRSDGGLSFLPGLICGGCGYALCNHAAPDNFCPITGKDQMIRGYGPGKFFPQSAVNVTGDRS